MNKRIRNLFIGFILAIFNFNPSLKASFGQFKKLFEVEDLSESKTFTEQLEREIERLKKKKTEQEEALNTRKIEFEKAQEKLGQLTHKAKTAIETTQEFSNKYILIFNQIIQIFTEVIQNYQQIIEVIDQNIKLLQEYKEDPEFKNKNLKLPLKSIYSIEDFQKITDLLSEYDNRIKTTEEKIKKSLEDLENRKKTLNLAKQEYEEKKKEQREFKSKNPEEEQVSTNKLTLKQRAELLDIEEMLSRLKKELAEIRVNEATQKLQLMEIQLKITKLQQEIIEKEYERIKNELRIDQKDVKKVEETLQEQILEANKRQDEGKKQIDTLELLKTNKLKQLSIHKEQYCLTDNQITAFEDWSFQPVNINSWKELITIGRLTNQIKFDLDIKIDDIKAQIEQDKAKIFDKEVESLITNSWFKLTTGKLDSTTQEQVAREIKQYEKAKADALTNISLINDRQTNAVNALNTNSAITENLKLRVKELSEQKNTIFKNNLKDFNNISIYLRDETIESAVRRAESITGLIEFYNSIINLRKRAIKKLDAMVEELKARLKWLGVPPLWKGIQNFIPNIKRFFRYINEKNIKQSLKNNEYYLTQVIKYYKNHPSNLLSLLFKAFIAFLIIILIKLYLPDIIDLIRRKKPQYGTGIPINNFLISTFSFINDYYLYFLIWTLGYLAIKYKIIIDSYLGIIFYLTSIPIWIYFTYRYINFLEKTNIESNYKVVSKEHQKRFFLIFSLILISSIIILFFREAFLLARLPKSDVPNTLLAINIIILQLGLIFLLSKDQLLKLIPKTTDIGNWIYDQVDHYYHFFLMAFIVIIILSNPYIGYGRHFFYIVSRLLLIGLLIPLALFLHNKIKKIFGAIFLTSDGEGAKERFSYARTYFGLSIIISFLFLIVLALIFAANILGYSIGFETIYQWLKSSLYEYTHPHTGQTVKVNILDFGRIFLYVLGAIIAAYLINKFILGRIFDLLLVNIGIQNAIQSLVRYLIIISAIVLGLSSIGYTSLVWTLLAVIAGLGVAGKEIVTDFIGYFIILIQRPLKIGDYIKIDEETTGVVRNITLRSVILRRKNSVTIIVPNSQIMTRPLVNWNYSRSYFAFEDIFITIPYSADPIKARELMLSTLDNNLNILKNPAPIVWLVNFTDNGFQFLIRGYISFDKVLDQWAISSDVRLELVRILRQNGISVASPTRLLKVIKESDLPENFQI